MRRFGSATPRPTLLMLGHLILNEGRKPGVEESVHKDAGQAYGSFDSLSLAQDDTYLERAAGRKPEKEKLPVSRELFS